MYYIEDIEKEKTIKQFETFDKLEILLYIKNYLEENPEILLDLEKRVLDKLNKDYEPSEEIIEEPEIKKSLPVQTLDEAFGEPEKLEE